LQSVSQCMCGIDLGATQNDWNGNQYKRTYGGRARKKSNTKDTMIYLPELGFQTKPTSPLRQPKGLGLFQPSQVILKIKLESSDFSRSRDHVSARYFTHRSLLIAFTMDGIQSSKLKSTLSCHTHFSNAHSQGAISKSH
jgi:hypothetical protein